jgi:hypothetical protein
VVSSTGESRDLPAEVAEGTLTCTVPMSELPCEVARNWGRNWSVAVGYAVIGP